MNNYILYHNTICPFSRKIRFLLDHLNIDYKKQEVKPYLKEQNFIKINPTNETPVLYVENEGINIVDSYIIAEYLKFTEYKNEDILRKEIFGNELSEILEINRLQMWFDKKFYIEVTKPLINELIIKTFSHKINTSLNNNIVSIIVSNLNAHISYIEYLLSKHKWLATEKFSLADITAATQISIADYFGYINWKRNLRLKDWYSIIKSKQGFKNILNDKVAGYQPSLYYNQLDF